MTTITPDDAKAIALFARIRAFNEKTQEFAEAHFRSYKLIGAPTGNSADAPGKVILSRGNPPVTVDTDAGTCSCKDHQEGGIVQRYRQAILNLGFTPIEAALRGLWAICRHEAVCILLQVHYPELFDPYGVRTVEAAEAVKAGLYNSATQMPTAKAYEPDLRDEELNGRPNGFTVLPAACHYLTRKPVAAATRKGDWD